MQRNETADTVFHALADGTRRAILHRLAQSPARVGELASPFGSSLAAISKHVKILEQAGLIRKERQGRTIVCRIDLRPLEEAEGVIRDLHRYWNDRLDELQHHLENSRKGEGNP